MEKKSLNLLSGSDTTATTHKHGSISHHSNNNVNGTEARSAPAALSLSSLCVFWEITFELFFFSPLLSFRSSTEGASHSAPFWNVTRTTFV